MFYSIAFSEEGRCGKTLGSFHPRPSRVKAVRSVHASNPPPGFVSLWGAFNGCRRRESAWSRDRLPGSDILGVHCKPVAANSSTMKGPRGLACQQTESRCQIRFKGRDSGSEAANGRRLWVRGSFWFLAPEIKRYCVWKLCRRELRTEGDSFYDPVGSHPLATRLCERRT